MPGRQNRLINESSPYLLQHAHNPVDWYPWGDEALEKAKKENKPILASIGYAACHWCHVMEKESFENEEIANLMNERFVNIKIDREERPDLDHIYMDAVQAMTGSGGWPLNVFLTPQAKPFFGGTYFPPQRAFNRSSWREILLAVSAAFQQKRDEIESQAENLTAHLLESNSFASQPPGDKTNIFARENIDETFQNLMRSADKEWGGFGQAPKFPQTFSIQFLLRYGYVAKKDDALKQALLSLDKMIEGGIYDQVGGGFSRYSTDREWLVPHFEKMLYDNALLVSTLSEAFQVTKNERYSRAIDETMGFVKTELMHPAGGFYSALDADSEGEEGKFYVWQHSEVKKLVRDNAQLFCDFFDITPKGNWSEQSVSSVATLSETTPEISLEEGKNILRLRSQRGSFASEKKISIAELEKIIQEGKSILLAHRNLRPRPLLDDKIILGWNALMNTACSKAFAATGNTGYRELAIQNMEFLLEHFKSDKHRYFFHTWKQGTAKYLAFLDDYAFLIQALLHLQEITARADWLFKAREIAEYVMQDFVEDETGFFFFTDIKQQDVILRKKEVYDGATPSGNATMAYNIYRLSILFDIPEWKQNAERMISSLSNAAIHYPTSFGIWSNLLLEMTLGTYEIAVVGEQFGALADQVLAEYIPHKVFMAAPKGFVELPLLAQKPSTNPALIYLCKAYSCLKPVSQTSELLELIGNGNKK